VDLGQLIQGLLTWQQAQRADGGGGNGRGNGHGHGK